MSSSLVNILSLIAILSGVFLIFLSGHFRHFKKSEMKANVQLYLGLVPLCLGGIVLLLEIL